MIKSMTGFGKGEYSDEKRHVTCEVRSVNHRYADISVRMPRRYNFAEDAIREVVKKSIARGKIEVNLNVETLGEDDVTIQMNKELAGKYMANLVDMHLDLTKKGLGYLSDEIRLEYIAGLPDVMRTVPSVEDEEGVTNAFVKATEAALLANGQMRVTEGKKLAEDIAQRGEMILSLVETIEGRGPELAREYAEKMRERIRELLGDVVDIPEERIALEAAVFADKSNVTEEIVRLKSHVSQLNAIMASDYAEGKKLDFLIQEMNREANTIGSKANDLATTNTMLEIKGEIEKIREQVQNIE